MSAWVSRERLEGGKRKRCKMQPGVRGVADADRFIVCWLDPDQRFRQERMRLRGRAGKRLADRRAAQITAQLRLGEYQGKDSATWEDFRREFEQKWVEKRAASTQVLYRRSLNLFEEICAPKLMRSINSYTVAAFEAGLWASFRTGATMRATTVNKHLRVLRVALLSAYKWNYLPKMPEV